MDFYETRFFNSFKTIFPARIETLDAIGESEFLDRIEGELDRAIEYPTLKRPSGWCYNVVFTQAPHGNNTTSKPRTRKIVSRKKAR